MQSILRVLSEHRLSRNHQKMLDLGFYHRKENKVGSCTNDIRQLWKQNIYTACLDFDHDPICQLWLSHFPFPNFGNLLPALIELSFSILTYEPHEAGWTSDRPLKYWTAASPVLLAAVVTWNVRPIFLLQWNLSWVKDKCVLSSFMAVFVRTIWSLVIPRYEVLTGSWEGGIEPITTLETSSHPPEMESCFLIRKNNRF